MQTKSIKIHFIRKKVTFTASLLWDEAPQTCRAVVDSLVIPHRAKARHAIWSGKEVFLYLPQTIPKNLPLENHSIFPAPGELMFFYMPENRLKGIRDIKYRDPGDVFELAIFYGINNLRLTMEMGWRGSIFARIEQNQLPELSAACEDLYWDGALDITINRE